MYSKGRIYPFRILHDTAWKKKAGANDESSCYSSSNSIGKKASCTPLLKPATNQKKLKLSCFAHAAVLKGRSVLSW
eukprot:scaffold3189_cov166-Amphora_coffeaeformis.AAC.7